jgi:hypothetical protein
MKDVKGKNQMNRRSVSSFIGRRLPALAQLQPSEDNADPLRIQPRKRDDLVVHGDNV